MPAAYFTACEQALIAATEGDLRNQGHTIVATHGPYTDVTLMKSTTANGVEYVDSVGANTNNWHVIHSTK